MYSEHPQITTPPDDTVIWRYMSIEKYVSLLHTASLFMCRVDKFEDPWEGTYPVGYEYLALGHPGALEARRGFLFVNCWHANQYESAAMWDLYASRQAGVAIRTTVGILKQSIRCAANVFLGAVRYADYSMPIPNLDGNTMLPALLKRHSFAHEHEIRLITLNFDDSTWHSTDESIPHLGFAVPGRQFMSCEVDLSVLLRDVMFSPSMPDWLFDALRDLSGRYQINASYTKSSLYDRRVL